MKKFIPTLRKAESDLAKIEKLIANFDKSEQTREVKLQINNITQKLRKIKKISEQKKTAIMQILSKIAISIEDTDYSIDHKSGKIFLRFNKRFITLVRTPSDSSLNDSGLNHSGSFLAAATFLGADGINILMNEVLQRFKNSHASLVPEITTEIKKLDEIFLNLQTQVLASK